MVNRRIKKLIVSLLLGTLLCIGLGLLAMTGSTAENEDSSKTGMHYELPQLIPTTWIGRQ